METSAIKVRRIAGHRVALGSLAEPDTQLELATRLGLLPAATHTSLTIDVKEIERMLRALGAALRRHASAGP